MSSSDLLEYWEYKHANGHPITADNSGIDYDCPFCNPEVMKRIIESGL